MDVRSGSYTGNGSSQTINTGASATPKLVLIKGAGTQAGVLRTDTMATDSAKPIDPTGVALATGVITALGAGSFSVGSDAKVNSNGVTYYWIALAHDGTNNDIETGSYTGNGLDNQNKSLSVITATPDMVWIASAGAERSHYRTSDFSGDLAQDIDGAGGTLANIIQSFGAGTFQIGNRASAVNTSATVYHWLALVNTANLFKVLTYNGDGTDDRNITGAGFAPDNAFTRRGNSINSMVFHPKGLGDSSGRLSGSGGFGADKIQALISDGFQVGTNADVNIATSTPPYYAFVFKDTAANDNETMALAAATAAMLDATVDVEVAAAVEAATAAMLDIDANAIAVAMDVAAATATMLDATADLSQLMGAAAAASASMLSLTADEEMLMEAMAAAAAMLDLELAAYKIWGELRREIDPADWSASPVVAYLEVHALTLSAPSPYRAYLYNETDGLVVAGSDVSTASLTRERVRSGAFSFAAGTKVYRVEFLSGHPMYDAVVIVDVG